MTLESSVPQFPLLMVATMFVTVLTILTVCLAPPSAGNANVSVAGGGRGKEGRGGGGKWYGTDVSLNQYTPTQFWDNGGEEEYHPHRRQRRGNIRDRIAAYEASAAEEEEEEEGEEKQQPSRRQRAAPLSSTAPSTTRPSDDTATTTTTKSSSFPPASTYSAKRRMARREGDIILGALFPVHHHPPIQTAYSRKCGGIREYYGIQRIEAFQRTVDDINGDPSILPHIRLGWDIRDSCWYSAIALEQSIDFIQDAIASKTIRDGRLVSALPHHDDDDDPPRGGGGDRPPQAGSKLSRTSSHADEKKTGASNLHPPTNNRNNDNPHEDGGCGTLVNKPIVGLIGPGSSEASIQVQNLMQIFNIPQIGYSATSMDLSDKNIYRYFLRVVPPDKYQVQALVDIVLAFNWTYISTVHSDGNYGMRGMEMFTDLVASYNICIASTDNVASSDSKLEFDRVVDTLKKTPNASVVVCFCEGITVKKLLQAISRKRVDGRFLIIGSDGWGNRLDVVEGQERTASGAISIKLYSPPLPHFDRYYGSLRPDGSVVHRNPWFTEFWQEKFHCYLPGDERVATFPQPCTGSESLANSDQDSKLGFVVNAVKTMALALHDMHSDLCPGRRGLCPDMTPINGTLFLEYLLNVSFPSYSGHDVHFDDHGDPPGRYEILNYQPVTHADGNVTYEYVTIGQWMTGNLELNESAIYWPGKGQNSDKPFNSVCSQPCGPGFVKQGVVSDGLTCCWVCTPCQDNEIVVDEAHCSPCALGRWPNDNKTDCEQIAVEFVTWLDTWSLVVVALACVGLLCTAWVTAIFIRSHNTPVVKASTRELSYILLLGIALAFSCNFLLVSKPAPVLCYLSRIVPGLAFSLMYGALVTRTNRIARILEGSKRIMTKKPRFMSATAQVVITIIIIGIECVIISAMLVLEPADSEMDYSTARRVRLVCNTSTLGIIVPLGFNLFLIFMCTLYAVKTRNLPENFNEAKFIGFTMYTTCVIWLGFFPIYFGGQKYQEVTLSVSISLSAAIALALLFFPKVYIILWAPEKNTRGAFTTSKDVRCHIGSKSIQSTDSVEFREGRYDSVSRAEDGRGGGGGKNSQSWKQKSLDEKRLRFVMKRTSIPAQLASVSPSGAGAAPPSSSSSTTTSSSSNYVNHGVLTNHKAAAAVAAGGLASSSFPPSHSRGGGGGGGCGGVVVVEPRKRLPRLTEHQQVSFSEFSDSDCMLQESDRNGEGRGGGRGGGGGGDAESGGGSGRVIVGGGGRGGGSSGGRGCGGGGGGGDVGGGSSSPGGRFRDQECQTGDDLVQIMFLQLRRRRFQSNNNNNFSGAPMLPSSSSTHSHSPSPSSPPSRQAVRRRDQDPVKGVTFSTHVVPVHVDCAWSSDHRHQHRHHHLPEPGEHQPLLGHADLDDEEEEEEEEEEGEEWRRTEGLVGGGCGGGDGAVRCDVHRRLSDLSPSHRDYRDRGGSNSSRSFLEEEEEGRQQVLAEEDEEGGGGGRGGEARLAEQEDEEEEEDSDSDSEDLHNPHHHHHQDASGHHHHPTVAAPPPPPHHTIYHRPPTPRTPRKLLIQNNHNDISTAAAAAAVAATPAVVDGCTPPAPQALSRDSRVLRVNKSPTTSSTPSPTPTPPTSLSLNSLLSQGSGFCQEGTVTGTGTARVAEGGSSGGVGVVETSPTAAAEREVSAGGVGAAHDKGVVELQQYLMDRGLSLDMSTVQTSNL
ncbi:uncharacterized protein LOC143297622 [Babylonia areolata]|uniref:uncharacterized protein LOC143297622 n=1 Tax=Babylonia areolata TaxID=304850 RepID=UPI003FD3BF00